MNIHPFAKHSLCFLALVTSLPAAETQIGTHRFTLPDGFEVELVAGPPLVDRPIAAAFDEQGRLYVSDSSGSNDKPDQQLIDRPHRIVRLEDSDGDGRFDRSVVFADRMMFPEGVMWLDGSLYVGAPPSIWKLTDRDGDGVAEQRSEWYQGKTLTGCANDIHGPYPGPDGRIYWCKGAFAEQTHERPGRATIRDRAAHIFRCRPDGSELESVMSGGMDNPVDIAFTRTGEPIFTATFLDLSGDGKRDGLAHAVYGGVFPKVSDVVEPLIRTGPLLPAMTHFGPGAPCGFTRLDSTALGTGFRDNFFTCLFNLHKVTRHILKPAGVTFRTIDSDFLVSDNPDFHPTDVIEDADGSLLIIDTGGWYKLCCPTSQLAKPDVLGAIYRVRRKGAPAVEDPRGLKLPWAQMQPKDMAELLSDARPAVVERATAYLPAFGDGAIVALRAVLEENRPALVRQRALWTLSRIAGEDARSLSRTALRDADEDNRQTAVKIAGLWRDVGACSDLINLLETGAPSLRRTAAEALGRIGDARAVPALLAASAHTADDRFLEHALIFALIEIGDAAATAHGLNAENPKATRGAALVALSEMNPSALSAASALPLLDSPDAALKQTAWWVAGRHADWGGELAGFFRTRLHAKSTDAERAEFETLLAEMARAPAIQKMIAVLLRDARAESRSTLLRATTRAQLKVFPEEWIDAVAAILEQKTEALDADMLKTANTLVSRKEGLRLTAPLLAVARDSRHPVELRLMALSALPAGAFSGESELFALLCQHLRPAESAATRAAAASVLSRAKLNDAQRAELIEWLPQLGPFELGRILPAFERPMSEPLARQFLAALRQTPSIAASQSQSIRTVLAKLPTNLASEALALQADLDVGAAQQSARLASLAAKLPAGDIRRGQLVFNGAKSACTVCHAVGYLGGKFGPDLTSIGQVRSERDLLEAIVFPSASFVRSYEPVILKLKNGGGSSGILRGETDDSLTLALGPGASQTFPRSEVEEITPGAVSLMPQGYDQALTRQELSDLVTFLKASVRKPN
jgi:putative membrane-bound dehydrogenase-like protein